MNWYRVLRVITLVLISVANVRNESLEILPFSVRKDPYNDL